MQQTNTRVFVLGHFLLSVAVFVIYILKSYQPVLLTISIWFFLWSFILMYFSYTNQLSKGLRSRNILNLIILIDSLLISIFYFLPVYENHIPAWIILIIIPFYAQELGSKAALRIGIMGTVILIMTNIWIRPNYDITIAIILEMVIFVVFIGKKTDRLNKLAFYDTLTELPNRLYMRKTLDDHLKSAKQAKPHPFYLFMIDLDAFKEVNDTYGHDTGDRLLQMVSVRMMDALPGHAEISRMGGDEFTVLLPKRNENDAELLANKLLECLETPIQIGDHTMSVSMSVGISMFPEDGEDATTLLKNADRAMYDAKNAGRNRYATFNQMAGGHP